MLGTFKDELRLCMMLEFVPGGELFTRLTDHPGGLPEREVQFILGCVVLVLEHLHGRSYACSRMVRRPPWCRGQPMDATEAPAP